MGERLTNQSAPDPCVEPIDANVWYVHDDVDAHAGGGVGHQHLDRLHCWVEAGLCGGELMTCE